MGYAVMWEVSLEESIIYQLVLHEKLDETELSDRVRTWYAYPSRQALKLGHKRIDEPITNYVRYLVRKYSGYPSFYDTDSDLATIDFPRELMQNAEELMKKEEFVRD